MAIKSGFKGRYLNYFLRSCAQTIDAIPSFLNRSTRLAIELISILCSL